MTGRPLVDLDEVSVVFPTGRGGWRQRRRGLRAVDRVSLSIEPGESLGLVGESGSGKTTLGRVLLRFVEPAAGTVRVGDHVITNLGKRTPLSYRRFVQVVFQDPIQSLNPSMSVLDIVGEPLRIHHGLRGSAQRRRCIELLDQVGLGEHVLDRSPHELSGGQRQRVSIARALAPEPGLVVLDEPVSALDVSTQSQVIGLLERLQRDTGATFLLIAHDLAVVRHACDRIAVMYRGRIVETGTADEVCDNPQHPYTALLLASVPDPDPVVQGRRRAHRQDLMRRDIGPSTPTGCVFVERCPHATDVCRDTEPETVATAAGGTVACHLHIRRAAGHPLPVARPQPTLEPNLRSPN